MLKQILPAVIFASSMLLGVASAAENARFVALPVIDKSHVLLRVSRAINPRFKTLSEQQFNWVLSDTKRLAKKYYSVNLEFERKPDTLLETLFQVIPESIKKQRRDEVINTRDSVSDAQKVLLANSVSATFDGFGYVQNSLVKFAQLHLTRRLPDDSKESLAAALVETLFDRMNDWHAMKAKDGKPVLDESAYNEWVWWDSLGYGELPYDVVITNQLVASAEKQGMDVHTALRGGITAGTTSYSKNASYGSYSFVSTFPFIHLDPSLKNIRGNVNYTDREAATLIADLLVHELGHQLFHFGHPFSNSACVMRPAELLQFRQWHQQHCASQCLPNSEPQMKVGAIKITY